MIALVYPPVGTTRPKAITPSFYRGYRTQYTE